MTFSDVELLVVHSIVMRLNEKESLAYLEGHGHKIQPSTFYKYKKKIVGAGEKRKIELTRDGLWEQHLQRIDQLETIEKLSWENFHREKDPSRKQKILESIANLQPLLSTYYHATQKVLEFDKARIQPRRYLPVRGKRTD